MAEFIGNLTAISMLLFLGLGFFYWVYFSDGKHEEKAAMKKALKLMIIICLIIFIICMITMSIMLATREKTPMEKYDDVMSGYNWGKDYYYDTNSHSVLKKPWKR